MTELEHQKALLAAKIDAHRTILGLELHAARVAFDPLPATLSLLGVDRTVVELLPPVLRALTASVRKHHEGAEKTEAGES